MNNSLIEKEGIEITGKLEKTSWYYPPFPPAVCIIKLNDVHGDVPYKKAVVFTTPVSCNNLNKFLDQITGDERFAILPYMPLPEESMVVRVKGRYVRCVNGDIVEDGDTVELDGYDIELVS